MRIDKNVYKVSFVIIGTLIGAGFASGQEIYIFFNRHGIKGLAGIFISSFLISLVIYKVFKIIIKNNINNYEEFIAYIIPNRFKENQILIQTIYNVIKIFLLISFNIMVVGFATYFEQELNISKWYGAILISGLAFFILLDSIDGIIKINTYLIPIILFLILFLGTRKIEPIRINTQVDYNYNIKWMFSSILYASYNSITLVPILISFKEKIKSKENSIKVFFLILTIMFLMSSIIFLLINTFINIIDGVEIPILYIASSLGSIYKYVYGVAILIAIFTTAISSGYGFLNNIVTTNKRKHIIYTFLICIISIFTGQLGFSNLIGLLYPIFGYLGIIQIFFIIIK